MIEMESETSKSESGDKKVLETQWPLGLKVNTSNDSETVEGEQGAIENRLSTLRFWSLKLRKPT